MNVGIVTKWFNRGQPVVGRYVRSAVDSLGLGSFVLAKPRREKGPMAGALERTGVWDQPGVTAASSFETPLAEYVEWIEANRIDTILCDQNYQFDELARLRARGVRVIGRFVWEHFTRDHVGPALDAYDVVYSVTQCEQERYRSWGLETPRVPWGIHPELLEAASKATAAAHQKTDAPAERQHRAAREERTRQRSILSESSPDAPAERPPFTSGAAREERTRSGASSRSDLVRFVFPGGFLGHRKPAEPVVEAFSRAEGENLRLLVKAQVDRARLRELLPMVEADPRIELRLADEPWPEHLAAIAANDVSISPSRWEGLGLPLYEAVAFGMPTITNDDPPMNEVVTDGVNGLLVPSHPDGTARSGIPARRPDIEAMAKAIERIAEPTVLAELRAGAERSRERFPWDRTVAALGTLLDR